MKISISFDECCWFLSNLGVPCPRNNFEKISKPNSSIVTFPVHSCDCGYEKTEVVSRNDVQISCIPELEYTAELKEAAPPTEIHIAFDRMTCIRHLMLISNAKFVEVYSTSSTAETAPLDYIKTFRGVDIPGAGKLHSIEVAQSIVSSRLKLKFLSIKKLENNGAILPSRGRSELPVLIVRDMVISCQGHAQPSLSKSLSSAVTNDKKAVDDEVDSNSNKLSPKTNNNDETLGANNVLQHTSMDKILSTFHTMMMKSIDEALASHVTPIILKCDNLASRVQNLEVSIGEIKEQISVLQANGNEIQNADEI